MHNRLQTPFDILPLPQQAGILCNEPQFQNFAAIRCGGTTGQCLPSFSAEYLRSICRVTSRRDLADNPQAAQRSAELRTEFDAWRGRIAHPRN
ncbi:hypothetical protein [Sulfitobacter sp. SH24]|uniref:hypothetical protein n=1 Tax=Sulfitobacter sp. SH24 TaxID=3421173 RepID=UPI003F4FAA5A